MTPLTVLVADDSPELLDVLQLALKHSAARIIPARNGDAAWHAIKRQKPRVAILDGDMPVLGGLEVARRVRADASLSEVRLLLVTGYSDLAAQAEEAGMHETLLKPFTPTELRAAVERLAALPGASGVGSGD